MRKRNQDTKRVLRKKAMVSAADSKSVDMLLPNCLLYTSDAADEGLGVELLEKFQAEIGDDVLWSSQLVVKDVQCI